jgi:SPP1 gp7 family putative phage head morphogenesis protein
MATDLDWGEEDDELYRVLLPLVRRAALDGAQEGLGALGGIGVDWGLVNQAVAGWARAYTFELVRQINGTTRAYLQREVPAWVQSGEPLEALIAALEPMFGKVRAEMIAATEVTRAFAEGNVEVWKASGVVGKKEWFTAEDELVCPICGPLAGTMVGLEEGFAEVGNPPAHVNCRCWLGPVVS